MSEETLDFLAELWGDPDPGAIEIIAADELSSEAWSRRPSLAILPFEELQPEWKVLRVDGLSPLQAEFDPVDYGLALPISALGTKHDSLHAYYLPPKSIPRFIQHSSGQYEDRPPGPEPGRLIQ